MCMVSDDSSGLLDAVYVRHSCWTHWHGRGGGGVIITASSTGSSTHQCTRYACCLLGWQLCVTQSWADLQPTRHTLCQHLM
jgi:hypothetical protein